MDRQITEHIKAADANNILEEARVLLQEYKNRLNKLNGDDDA